MPAPVPVRKTSSAPSRSTRESERSLAARPRPGASFEHAPARHAVERAVGGRRRRERAAAQREDVGHARLGDRAAGVEDQRFVGALPARFELGQRVVQVVEALHARIDARRARGAASSPSPSRVRARASRADRSAPRPRCRTGAASGSWWDRRRARPRRASRRDARRRRRGRARAACRARCRGSRRPGAAA